MKTLIHERVEAARRGDNPTVICRVRSGWIVIGDNQVLRGYSLLLADPVVGDLNSLGPEQRVQFCADMIGLGDALLEATESYRINYSIAGNLDPALHAHVRPRYLSEPDNRRHRNPTVYGDDPPVPFDVDRDRQLMVAICDQLVRGGYAISSD